MTDAVRRVCMACGSLEILESETHCGKCFEAVASSRAARDNPGLATRTLVEKPSPNEERIRELLQRKRLDDEAGARKPLKKHEAAYWAADDWFQRHGPGVPVCWHCRRSPGEDQYHGACAACMGGKPQIQQPKGETLETPNTTPAVQSVQSVQSVPKEERFARIKQILANAGPHATRRQVYDAIRAAGIQTPGVETYYAMRRELWPDLPPRTGRPGVPKGQRKPPTPRAVESQPAPAPIQVQEEKPESPVRHLEAVARAVKWCGGWDELRRLVDAMESMGK